MRDDVDDIVQDTYLRVFKNIDKFDGTKSTMAYLTTIMQRLDIDAWRKKQRQGFPEFREVNDYKNNLYYEEEITFEFSEELQEGLKLLKARERHVMLLAYVYDFSLEEIAKILNISLGLVKTDTFRAKQKLKKFYEKEN